MLKSIPKFSYTTLELQVNRIEIKNKTMKCSTLNLTIAAGLVLLSAVIFTEAQYYPRPHGYFLVHRALPRHPIQYVQAYPRYVTNHVSMVDHRGVQPRQPGSYRAPFYDGNNGANLTAPAVNSTNISANRLNMTSTTEPTVNGTNATNSTDRLSDSP